MSRSLDELSAEFYPLACEWVARVTARGVAVMIVQTSRTIEEHQANLLNGTSGTRLSLHLPRKLRLNGGVALSGLDKVDAMDIAPFEVYQAAGPDKVLWNTRYWGWGVIGEEAERIGLRWGGRWRQPFDPGHAELIFPNKTSLVAEERSRVWPSFNPRENA